MASWRDSASAQCQADLDGLVGSALPFAQQMLDKSGEFYPYGLVVTDGGEVRMVGGHTGSEHPPSAEVLDLLYDGARSEATKLRAVAFVADVRVHSPDGDAIRVELEHKEGVAIAVLLPYEKRRFRGGIAYGQLRAAPGQPRVWL